MVADGTDIVGELAGLQSRLLFPQAVQLARDGRYREAEEWLKFLLDRGPSAHAYCLLGKVYGQQARYADAVAAFERALAVQPDHAEATDALHCVRSLSEPVPASSLSAWKLVSSVAIAVAMIAIGVALRPTSGAPGKISALESNERLERMEHTLALLGSGQASLQRDLDSVASRLPQVVREPTSEINAARAGDTEADTVELMQAYGVLIEVTERLRTVGNLSLQPSMANGHGVVAVAGTVPSTYIRDELTSMLLEHDGKLQVDASAVQITNRYTIRPRDTLGALASTLCGRSGAWVHLWAANHRVIEDPGQLKPGTTIVVSCR
jgi:hypothetical protein